VIRAAAIGLKVTRKQGLPDNSGVVGLEMTGISSGEGATKGMNPEGSSLGS